VRITPIAVPLYLLISSVAFAQEDPRVKETAELTRKAQEAMKTGKAAAARDYMAESLAIWADILWDKGEIKACERHFFQAREMGWMGAPPWDRDRRPPTYEQDPKPERTPTPQPEPIPTRKPVQPRVVEDLWPMYELAPLASTRGNVWNGLLEAPPFEDAHTIKGGTWNARGRLELSQGSFSDDGGGGPSVWDASLAEESLQVDYGVGDEFQAGLRLVLSQLLENNSKPITLFENSTQIVPTEHRHWFPSEIVLRGKYAHEFGRFSLGALLEAKIPVASSDDLTTSGTFDVALAGLMTYRAHPWAFHVNLGFVLPMGSSGLFNPDEDPNPFITFSVGGALEVSERFAVIAQLEGNTSGWTDIAVLDLMAFTAMGGIRWKVGDAVFLTAGVQAGFTELSADMGFFGSLETVF